MANYTLTPSPFQKFFRADGVTPNANGRVYTYLAGLATPATTYASSSGTANSNPIVLDGAGQCAIFLAPGSYSYAVYAAPTLPNDPSSGGLIETQDNITAVGGTSSNNTITGIAGETITDGQVCYISDGSGGKVAGRWYLAKADNAYSSLTPELAFSVGGASVGASGTFMLSGQVTTGIAVTVGSFYYVSDVTAGSMIATAPGNSRAVGFADSGTSLIAFPNPPVGATGYDYVGLQSFG